MKEWPDGTLTLHSLQLRENDISLVDVDKQQKHRMEHMRVEDISSKEIEVGSVPVNYRCYRGDWTTGYEMRSRVPMILNLCQSYSRQVEERDVEARAGRSIVRAGYVYAIKAARDFTLPCEQIYLTGR